MRKLKRRKVRAHLSIGGRPACGAEGRRVVVESPRLVTCPTCLKVIR